jgi:hypothetical protein
MKQLTEEILQESVLLINALRSGRLSEKEISATVEKIDTLLPDPRWFDYAIDHTPEMSAEEVVRKAFSYRPIQL